jgi:hypothetical protein
MTFEERSTDRRDDEAPLEPRDADDPRGDTAYPGGGMLPPTGDMEQPIPEAGLPGEPKEVPDLGRDVDPEPERDRT